MRFGFYTSLSLTAILASESRAILSNEIEGDDQMMHMQVNWGDFDDEQLGRGLAQIDDDDKVEYDQFSQVHSESESGSESESESESGSDSDTGLDNLELAQQM